MKTGAKQTRSFTLIAANVLYQYHAIYQLTDRGYVDDIAIFAPSACVLQEPLSILQEEAKLVGMQISWPKTKRTNHLPLKICNNEVLFVDFFTYYLGSLITNDGSSSRDI